MGFGVNGASGRGGGFGVTARDRPVFINRKNNFMSAKQKNDDRNSRQLRAVAVGEMQKRKLINAYTNVSDTLLHELNESQINLEIQNENLREMHVELEESRDRYLDLYDFAPIGYLTVSERGIIVEANLTASTMLGVERSQLVHHRFDRFIAAEEKNRWHLRVGNLQQAQNTGNFELMLRRADGSLFPAMLSGRWASKDGPSSGLRLTLTDISDAWAAREQSALEQEVATYSHGLDMASRRLLVAEEETKRRLSAALHDRTSPNLAAIKLNLKFLAAEFSAESTTRYQRLEDLRALIDDTEVSVREICAELRPPVLDYAGLPAALDQYAHRFRSRTGIAVDFVFTGDEDRLESSIESMLFRIFQEALTNCAKHADAKSVKIALFMEKGRVALSIADDGTGMDLASIQHSRNIQGLGLLNMREMVELSGGHFSIESRPGKGTRIAVSLACLGQDQQPMQDDCLPVSGGGNGTEEYFQRFFNFIPELACIVTVEGRFLRINTMWQETLGYTSQEILSSSFFDFIHPEDREATESVVERQVTIESTMQFVNRYRCKDGSYRWLEWRSTPAVGGKLLFSSARDITRNKEAHDVLTDLRALLNEAEEIPRLGGWRYDCATGRVTWSDDAYHIYGVGKDYDPSDVNRDFQFFADQDKDAVQQAFRHAVCEGKPYDLELPFVCLNGERIWIRTIGKPTIEGGKVVNVTGSMIDITARKKMEPIGVESEKHSHDASETEADPIWVKMLRFNMTQGQLGIETLALLSGFLPNPNK
jgi:PAS domain S-box-containing protein